MSPSVWESSADPAPMLECLKGKATERQWRLFAVACCRPLLRQRDTWHTALDIAEEVADRKPDRSLQRSWDDWATMVMEEGTPIGWALHFALADFGDTGLDRDFADWAAGLRPGVAEEAERARFASLLRCIFGNPERPVTLAPARLTPTIKRLARAAYEKRRRSSGELDPQRLRVLSDALEEAGADAAILDHLRGPGPHARGCFAIDLVLEKR